MIFDHWVAMILAPLAVWVLINGCDDIVMDVAAAIGYLRIRFSRSPNERIPTEAELDAAPPIRMAIFVALWQEHRVIRKMVENNVTRLNYPRFDFFIGTYPNDIQTTTAVEQAVRQFPNVHMSVCPHNGPTSKADCLNWIYQRMLLYEEENGVRFDMVLTHDAEDIMEPDALRWINYYAQWNDMVQIPVLALPTPLHEISHGVYCDEFAEFQMKDMIGRQCLKGFIPSNGVGTGFSRRALGMLAAAHSNRIFEPGCLTEDYENGFRIHRLGLAQKFIPVVLRHGRAIATREFFPRKFGTAVRQRSRWIIGNTLQSWEFHTLRETLANGYWFWRDRKGVVGNLVSPLTNVLFVYGMFSLSYAQVHHIEWGIAKESHSMAGAYLAGLGIQLFHTLIRVVCSRRIYGWRFAAAVPLRVLAGNWINCFATCRAIWSYGNAKLRGVPLRWAKTEHAYPSRAALVSNRKKLGEILVGSLWITQEQLTSALAEKPVTVRLGEYLVAQGILSEQDLYTALSLQNELPLGIPDDAPVVPAITRSFPLKVVRQWKVMPFRIAGGELLLAGAEIPKDEMHTALRRFSSLELRFHLVTLTEFEALAEKYL